ncbi:MAG: hypothetical protein U9N84_06270 [Actinomycetota bacterium]|nr:hypothetical protein [Actinomycetota bacterium]
MAVSYALVTIAVNILVLGSVVAARVTGHDERADVPDLHIKNFHEVDERLLAGAQPTGDAFERLAAMGVTTVVDLRTGVVETRFLMTRTNWPRLVSSTSHCRFMMAMPRTPS